MVKKGNYEAIVQEKGKNEAFIDGIKEGECFYTVGLGEGVGYDTKSQFEAEVLSRLVKIEKRLSAFANNQKESE